MNGVREHRKQFGPLIVGPTFALTPEYRFYNHSELDWEKAI